MLITLCLLSRELNNFHFQRNLPSQCIVQYLDQNRNIVLLLTSVPQSRGIFNVLPWQRVGARKKKWFQGRGCQFFNYFWGGSCNQCTCEFSLKQMPALVLQARFTLACEQALLFLKRSWVLLEPSAYLDIIIFYFNFLGLAQFSTAANTPKAFSYNY